MRGIFLVAFLLAGMACCPSASGASRETAGMERKIQHLQSNSVRKPPDPQPTEFTESEINAYFAAGKVALPEGVQSVHFSGQPGVITAASRVDFDRLKSGPRSMNPLLSVFSGIHDVVVVAHAHGSGGQGYVHVDSVSLDDVEIPRFVLQLFVEKYLQPKYSNLGLDSRFLLPQRINTATVGSHKVTVTQK